MTEYSKSISDIETGAKWAKWYGLVKAGLGLFVLFVLASVDDTMRHLYPVAAADALWNIAVGSISLALGLKLLKAEARRSSHFTWLIWLYGFSLLSHLLAIMASGPGQATSSVVPLLTAWALWMFVKGRRALRMIERAPILEGRSA